MVVIEFFSQIFSGEYQSYHFVMNILFIVFQKKKFLEKKLKSKKIFDFNDSNCLIKTEGSPKHQELLIKSKKKKRKKKFYLFLVHY